MIKKFLKKFTEKIEGEIVNITSGETCDMGGNPMWYQNYDVLLTNGRIIILEDKIMNSRIVPLGLSVGSKVKLNGFGKLIK